jgi:two-component system NarL family sensor kinase
MPNENQEIYVLIIIGSILALLLVGFIVMILFLYQRRQHRSEEELARVKDMYDQELLKSQLEIQENTLKNLSQELHDNIGQLLSVTKLSLAVLPISKDHDSYEPVQNAREMLNKAILDLSALTKSLHSDRISQVGLVESIRYEVESIQRTGLVKIDMTADTAEAPFSGQKEVFLFRIFQEIVNNILKHSHATAVKVDLNYNAGKNFILRIEDNGVGFDVEEMKASVSSSKGVGLRSLFNRAKLIGAEMDMKSESGKGVQVTVELPLLAQTNGENGKSNQEN